MVALSLGAEVSPENGPTTSGIRPGHIVLRPGAAGQTSKTASGQYSGHRMLLHSFAPLPQLRSRPKSASRGEGRSVGGYPGWSFLFTFFSGPVQPTKKTCSAMGMCQYGIDRSRPHTFVLTSVCSPLTATEAPSRPQSASHGLKPTSKGRCKADRGRSHSGTCP
jgi:hypothetical protein